MKPLTLQYAIENNFDEIDCVMYFKPNWLRSTCVGYIRNSIQHPLSIESLIEQLNKKLIEPEQHTVLGC